MPNLQIEFTDDTLVVTENGLERLADILHRPVRPALWAIRWLQDQEAIGISFHKSHKAAKQFAEVQYSTRPAGPARLIDVSSAIYTRVQEQGHCWTDLDCFSEAITYGEQAR